MSDPPSQTPSSGGTGSGLPRRTTLETEQLAAQMSVLLAELVHAPEVKLSEGWTTGVAAGQQVGRFVLERQLGRGGFGEVWEASDPGLGRTVALKVVRPGAALGGRSAEAMQREAEAVARLNHPGIVTLYDFGTCEAGPYLVFERLSGQPLDALLAERPLGQEESLRVAVQVARALVHAHAEGVLHRDLKPANVFVTGSGRVKVLDFGLAHLFGQTGPGRGGTPAFMAPEQWRGEPGDARTDLFAFGAMLHAMLSGGAVPYSTRSGRSAVMQAGPTPELPAGAAPRRLRRLVRRCLERDPADRPVSAQEVLAELTSLQRSLESRWRRRLLLGLGAVAACAVLAAGWLWWSREPPPGERLEVVAADVENQTGDPALDGLTGLLATSLESSRRLRLVPRSRLFTLARDARLGELKGVDASAARELARLARAQVVLAWVVRREGSGFALELRGRDAGDDRPLFTVSEHARDRAELPAVVDRVAGAVRRGLHERREDLRGSGLEVATAVSPSLEAAQAYFTGVDCVQRPGAAGASHAVHCMHHFEEALAHDPSFALAHFQVAYILNSDPEGETYRRHLDAALRGVDRVSWRDAALVRAFAAGQARRLEEALGLLDGILARSPEDHEAIALAAWFAGEAGHRDAAIPYWERMLALDPKDDSIVDDLVDDLGILGRQERLRQLVATQQALPPTPERVDAIVRALVWLGEARAALELVSARLGASPSRLMMLDLTTLQEILGDFDAAERIGREAVVRRPTWPPARWQLAKLLAAQGRLREARVVLDAIDPHAEGIQSSTYPFVRGMVLSGGGDARVLWSAAIGIRSLDARSTASQAMAPVLALLGDVAHAGELVRSLPAASPVLRSVEALAAWRAGNAAGALAELRAVEEVAPRGLETTYPCYLIAEVSAAAGEWGETLAATRRFARLWTYGYDYGWISSRMLLLSARAHAGLGEKAAARADLDRLLHRLRKADADFPLLLEARALRRTL